MKNWILPLMILTLPLLISAQDETFFFKSDEYQLEEQEKAKIHALISQFNPDSHEYRIVGHCDMAGSVAYNMTLSDNRVRTIKNLMIQNGIPSEKIRTESKGESEALDVARAYRRVDVYQIEMPRLLGKTRIQVPEKVEVKEEVPVDVEYEPVLELVDEEVVIDHGPVEDIAEEDDNPDPVSLQDYIRENEPTVQEFKFHGNYPKVIKGEKDTRIRIPTNAFVRKDGKEIIGEITLSLKEFTTKKDMVINNLNTISKGNPLISLGMIDISAKDETDAELDLDEGVSMEILFPTPMESSYYTFYGERDDEGMMDWEIDKRYTREGQPSLNLDDYGVVMTKDGSGLRLVEKSEAKKRNKKTRINGMSGTFRELTKQEKDSIITAYEKRVEYERKVWEESKRFRTLIESSRMGIINCDRFMEDEKMKEVEFLVNVKNDDVQINTAYIVFEKRESVIQLRKEADKYFFLNARMPVEEDIKLIVTAFDNQGNVYLYTDSGKLRKKTSKEIMVEPTSREALDMLLSGL